MNITAKTDNNLTKIYINEILHIAYVRCNLVSLQSWKDFEKHTIQLTFKGGAATLIEYDDMNKWIAVLKLLEDNLYP